MEGMAAPVFSVTFLRLYLGSVLGGVKVVELVVAAIVKAATIVSKPRYALLISLEIAAISKPLEGTGGFAWTRRRLSEIPLLVRFQAVGSPQPHALACLWNFRRLQRPPGEGSPMAANIHRTVPSRISTTSINL